jgi:alpha-glucosidase
MNSRFSRSHYRLSLTLAAAFFLSANSASYASVNGKNEGIGHSAVLSEASKQKDPWWKHAVFYEIYPRSFKDTNGDGIGDINGITSELDYLKWLGVDAIWITPCYPSPQVDFGYDISDYEAIAPEYGTMADFDRLVAEANKRGIRILMDLVMNHTSDQHPWFVQSASSKDNPKRDWYVWRDGKNGGPPNNWQSLFGHSAWKLDPKTNQYYYHLFYPEQPDLNYRNPAVRTAMNDVARFWLNKGVAGFRLDAVGAMFEDEKFPDNPVLEGTNAYGDPNTEYKFNTGLPELHDVLRDLRKVLNSYPGDRVLIGETSGNMEEIAKMFGKDNDEIQLPMNFQFMGVQTLSAPQFREQIAAWNDNPAKGWPLYFLGNHDQRRPFTKFGDGANNDKIAKLLAAMLLTLRGSPIVYYGEEIGMENYDPIRREDVQDPIGKIGWPKEKGRDGERTPMQWQDTLNAGFSQHRPWLPVALNYPTHNVKDEQRSKMSLLAFYKQLIDLRRKRQSLLYGDYKPLNEDDKNVLAFLRIGKNEKTAVILNMSNKSQTIKIESGAAALSSQNGKVILSSESAVKQVSLDQVNLKPFQTLILQVH